MASVIFGHQLQPFEENQSPSPVEEIEINPFDRLHHTRSRSPPRSPPSNTSKIISGTSPSPTNTLHRQLSTHDSTSTEISPPAWKRRESFTTNTTQQQQQQTSPTRLPPPPLSSTSSTPPPSTKPTSTASSGTKLNRSASEVSSAPPPKQPSFPPTARRHPNLMMTTSSSDPIFSPPQPAFAKQKNQRSHSGLVSNRYSTPSDLSGMTSEELWNMDNGSNSTETYQDRSNPARRADERPLDTVRRMSIRTDRPRLNQAWSPISISSDMLWPEAPAIEEPILRVKSKSTTNVPGLVKRGSRLGRMRSIKNLKDKTSEPVIEASVVSPPSPDITRSHSVFISSAHSSSTDLTKPKSTVSLSRPPSSYSAYYSHNFMTQLAPREGGYAVAAMLASPTSPGASPVMSTEESRRRSQNLEHHSRSNSRQPPISKSAGMGRWSLDGGDNYSNSSRMLQQSSASSIHTISSNLSGPALNSPGDSPPADDKSTSMSIGSSLPEGASPAISTTQVNTSGSIPTRLDTENLSPIPTGQVSSTTPNVPSPLSRSVTDQTAESPITQSPISSLNPAAPSTASSAIPIPPIPEPSTSTTLLKNILSPKKSKKELKTEKKNQEKVEATKIAAERAEKLKVENAKKAAEREKAIKEKEEMKRKEKEEKELKKLEKERLKKEEKEKGLKSGSSVNLVGGVGKLLHRNTSTSVLGSAAGSIGGGLGGSRRGSVNVSESGNTNGGRSLSMPPGALPPSTSSIGLSTPSITSPSASGSTSNIPPSGQNQSHQPSSIGLTNPSIQSSSKTDIPQPISVPLNDRIVKRDNVNLTADAPKKRERLSLFGTIKKRFSMIDPIKGSGKGKETAATMRSVTPGPTPPSKSSPVEPPRNGQKNTLQTLRIAQQDNSARNNNGVASQPTPSTPQKQRDINGLMKTPSPGLGISTFPAMTQGTLEVLNQEQGGEGSVGAGDGTGVGGTILVTPPRTDSIAAHTILASPPQFGSPTRSPSATPKPSNSASIGQGLPSGSSAQIGESNGLTRMRTGSLHGPRPNPRPASLISRNSHHSQTSQSPPILQQSSSSASNIPRSGTTSQKSSPPSNAFPIVTTYTTYQPSQIDSTTSGESTSAGAPSSFGLSGNGSGLEGDDYYDGVNTPLTNMTSSDRGSVVVQDKTGRRSSSVDRYNVIGNASGVAGEGPEREDSGDTVKRSPRELGGPIQSAIIA